MLDLNKKSVHLRKSILRMVYESKAGHIGGDLSVIDILNVLYNKHMNVSSENIHDPERDRFILSKGHCAYALYSVLCDKGFFAEDELKTLNQFDSIFIGHPTVKVNGIEMCSGSLGHGLSVAAGMALAGKMDASSYRVYTVMGDGEIAEGSVWEGAMLAGHYKLDNLIAIIDRNGLQISGETEQVMAQEDLKGRFLSFGWNVINCVGNDIGEIDFALSNAKLFTGKPTAIIAKTIKGCGISFMENNAGWHHRVPTAEEFELAMSELTAKEAAYNE